MKRTDTQTTSPDPHRLISLVQARALVHCSEREYYRNPSVLPKPIRRGRRHLFIEAEVRALVEKLAAERDVA